MDSRAGISSALALALLFLFPVIQAEISGKDLGVHGKLYEIKEESMVSYVNMDSGSIAEIKLRSKFFKSNSFACPRFKQGV